MTSSGLQDEMRAMGQAARHAALALAVASAQQRSAGIRAMAARLREAESAILKANAADMAEAKDHQDRLLLDAARVEAIASSLEEIAEIPDPVGTEVARWVRPNGLDIARVRTPIGVIGMIYEARPNVTADAAAICLRSGNAVILRSGSDAQRSALAIHAALVRGLTDAALDPNTVQIVTTTDREAVGMMLSGLDGAIDLIIPRGGKALVERVSVEARVPVLGHLEGICHSYVHAGADPAMAVDIVRNAKLRRVSVCGATETLLIDREVALELLPPIAGALAGCELRGDEAARAIVPMNAATAEDWDTEYLLPIIAIRLVDGINEAIDHIARHGTGHTDAIITDDVEAAEEFLSRVDSAIAIWNASTQFADGGEFGFGAEIGIATGKLHARGPVGPEQLTSFKYKIRGSGQTRP
jgi:glutamate-5-semialdehyde dehydrogenase